MPKIALIQMKIVSCAEENLRHAAELVKAAAHEGADFAVLPEMFCCPYISESFVKNKESAGGRIWQALSAMARDNGIYLIGGSMPEEDKGRLYNSCFVFDREGRQLARHRKMHMFDIDIKGGQYFRESDTFTAGNDVTLADTEFGRIGIEICFDIRFEELTRLMALGGAKMIFVPANFNRTTGPVHWQLLFSARALDNQLYMFGCSAAGNEKADYVSYGHSIAVSPWAEVLGQLEDGEDILLADIPLQRVDEVRSQLPVLSCRREAVYSLTKIR